MDVGSIILYSLSNLPTGFLECNGDPVSRYDYAELFDVIGTRYGIGDGSTTFNLPDFSANVPVGVSLSHALGSTGGEATTVLYEENLPSHVHNIPAHTHGNDISASFSLSHSITQQPTFNYVRVNTGSTYTSGRDSRVLSGRGSGTMTRTQDVEISNHAGAACTVSGDVTDCDTFDSISTGGGQAHNNMMPYLALRFLIRAVSDRPVIPSMVLYNGAMPVGPSGCYIAGRR